MTIKKIFFVHTVATAGGDFAYYLQHLYNPNSFICVPDVKPGTKLNSPTLRARYREELLKQQYDSRVKKGDKINLIYGHIPYLRNYKELYDKEFQCMTLVRDPVKRFVSHYREWINKNNSLKEFKALEESWKSLPNDIPSEANDMNFNLQTSFISGFNDHGTCYKEMTDDILNEAKKNIRKFAFIGVSDQFDESVRLFSKIMHKKYIYLKPLKKYKAKNIMPVSSDILKYIEEKSIYDYSLYNFAKERFNEQVKLYKEQALITSTNFDTFFGQPIKRANLYRCKSIAKMKNIFLGENIHI